jgi:hypothetical protein
MTLATHCQNREIKIIDEFDSFGKTLLSKLFSFFKSHKVQVFIIQMSFSNLIQEAIIPATRKN